MNNAKIRYETPYYFGKYWGCEEASHAGGRQHQLRRKEILGVDSFEVTCPVIDRTRYWRADSLTAWLADRARARHACEGTEP